MSETFQNKFLIQTQNPPQNPLQNPPQNPPQITHLVLSGGGINGFASLGALDYLVKHKRLDMDNIRVIAGSSVGAIIALLLVCNYTPKGIYDEILNEDMTTYFQPDLNNLIDHCGFDTGVRFVDKIKELLRGKNINPYVTFQQLYNLTKRKLIITATLLNERTVKYFDYVNYPNRRVIDAVRASFGVPILFTTVKAMNNSILEHYVDGGLLDNFPLHLFRDVPASSIIGIKFTKHQDEKLNHSVQSEKSKGLKSKRLKSEKSKRLKSKGSKSKELNHIGDVIIASISCVLHELEYLRSMLYKEAYEKSCVMIDIEDREVFDSLSFNMTKLKKKKLFKQGKQAARKYLKETNEIPSKEMNETNEIPSKEMKEIPSKEMNEISLNEMKEIIWRILHKIKMKEVLSKLKPSFF